MEGLFQAKRSLQTPTLKREPKRNGSLTGVDLGKVPSGGFFSRRLQAFSARTSHSLPRCELTIANFFSLPFCGGEFQVIITRNLSVLPFFLTISTCYLGVIQELSGSSGEHYLNFKSTRNSETRALGTPVQ